MNTDGDAPLLRFDGLACWLPVPLGCTASQAAEQMVRGVYGDAELTPDLLVRETTVAEQVVTLVHDVAHVSGADAEVRPVMAWAYLADMGAMTPSAIAWLRLVDVPVEDEIQVLAWFAQDLELLDTPVPEPLETGIGTASATRARVLAGPDRDVHHLSMVTWVLAQQTGALVLSCQTADLLTAPRLDVTLRELATTARFD